MKSTWDDERKAILRKAAFEGKTQAQAAALTRSTRNAVASQAKKLGLSFHGYSKSTDVKQQRLPDPEPPTPIPAPRDAGVLAEAFENTTRAVVALERRTCRWPIGDPRVPGFHFCCAPQQPESAYCPEHAARSIKRDTSTFSPNQVAKVVTAMDSRGAIYRY